MYDEPTVSSPLKAVRLHRHDNITYPLFSAAHGRHPPGGRHAVDSSATLPKGNRDHGASRSPTARIPSGVSRLMRCPHPPSIKLLWSGATSSSRDGGDGQVILSSLSDQDERRSGDPRKCLNDRVVHPFETGAASNRGRFPPEKTRQPPSSLRRVNPSTHRTPQHRRRAPPATVLPAVFEVVVEVMVCTW